MAKAIKIVSSGSDSVPQGKHRYDISGERFEVDAKYEPLELLGAGGHGTVCSAFNLETNEIVAIKRIREPFEYVSNGHRLVSSGRRTLREIRLLRQMNLPFFIRLLDVMKPAESERLNFQSVYIVYELMDANLQQVIRTGLPLPDKDCKLYLNQILRALRYIHSANVAHRDIKPCNILVDYNKRIKICDFGVARVMAPEGRRMTTFQGIGFVFWNYSVDGTEAYMRDFRNNPKIHRAYLD